MSTARPSDETVFETALELNGVARETFLAEICADNPGRGLTIKKLIAAHEKAEQFFHVCQSALAGRSEPADAADAEPMTAETPALEEVGMWIGVYKLLQKIGEGGCGVVYLAEQRKPVRRRVALKIIKLGMDTNSVIARFEAERQALALMEHPNIAKVLDAGVTATGRPFFVMELVNGVKITDFCDQRELDTSQRLDLFIQVCHAIQHAHQKGIIHRDIKPSNILVTLHDGAPVSKVIDFGIAKAIGEERLTDKTLFTIYGHFIGTPAYMSPEQADRSGLDIDTRSDIYSLGVLLYELLTGRTPFNQTELMESGLDQMRRILRETEPQRPSARLNTLAGAELTSTAQQRHVEAPKLVSQLRGDLDWIVMKALEKDRRRRYETANGLAMDIQRHRKNEPVVARPPSRLYRFQKLVRRNLGVFVAVGAVALALLIGLGTSTWLFVKERKLEQQQSQLRREAEQREQIAKASLMISQGKYAEADHLAEILALDQPTLDGAAVLRALGEWNAQQGRWQAALARFNQLLRVNQLDSRETFTRDFFECAAVLATAGQLPEFEGFRRQIISRCVTESDPVRVEELLEADLLLPADESELAALRPLARMVVPKTAMSVGNPRSGPASGNPLGELKLQNIGTDQPSWMTNENGVITLRAGGSDIWGGADAFAYAFTVMTGDFDCRLRVRWIEPTVHPYTRVGLMARESLNQPGGRQLMVTDTATNLFQVIMRVENDWGAVSMPNDSPRPDYGSNSWVRLQRTGTIFLAYVSSNSVDWVPLYKTTGGLRVFADQIYVGIAASSHSSNQLATFTVSDFGPTPTLTANRAVTLALLDYRRGDYLAAAEWCNMVLAYSESDSMHRCSAQIILAMADEQMHNSEESRQELDSARSLIGLSPNAGWQSGSATEGVWFEWVYVQALLQEAAALIEKPEVSHGGKH